MATDSDLINLNVGGVIYATTRKTLTSHPDSRLAAMFNGDGSITHDHNGNNFIDRDGQLFRLVLDFLRSSEDAEFNLPEDFKELSQLRAEVAFYRIKPLMDIIDTLVVNSHLKKCSIGGVLKPGNPNPTTVTQRFSPIPKSTVSRRFYPPHFVVMPVHH
jgi:hypothetical protein